MLERRERGKLICYFEKKDNIEIKIMKEREKIFEF
jgi:hypothetical protein